MKYKVGDKVKIKNNLKSGEWCGDATFTHGMLKYRGKTATIKEIVSSFYLLDIDDGERYWTSEMLEDAAEKDNIKLTLKQDEIIVSGISKFELKIKQGELTVVVDGEEVGEDRIKKYMFGVYE